MTPESLVNSVLETANTAHLAHLASRNYAEHVALGEFYEGAREAVDSFIEAAIGDGLPVPGFDGGPILAQIEKEYECLSSPSAREETCQGCSTLENLYDELMAVYVKAIYKLKRFK